LTILDYKQIESLLEKDKRYSIKQTYWNNFPKDTKQDYRQVNLDIFGLLLEHNKALPYHDLFSRGYRKHPKQSLPLELHDDVIKGRIARQWASFIREYHAYCMFIQIGRKYGLSEYFIKRNLELDNMGTDILIENEVIPENSFKIDIFQSTSNSKKFRDKKDTTRKNWKKSKGFETDDNIPGIKITIELGLDTEDGINNTKEVNKWYLVNEETVENLIKIFTDNYDKKIKSHPLQAQITKEFNCELI
tara:strand:- start:2747 stop:3487 length:741 start_codon:yes stop_codon:yes gene_type:complete